MRSFRDWMKKIKQDLFLLKRCLRPVCTSTFCNDNVKFFNTAPTHLSSWESRVLDQRGCGASRVGLGTSIFPHWLAQTLGDMGGGGAAEDLPGWWRNSRGSGEPGVLMPGPVIWMWLSVKLLGNLINLGQRNKCIHNWCLVRPSFHASGSKCGMWWKVLPASGAEPEYFDAAETPRPGDLQGGLLFEDLADG